MTRTSTRIATLIGALTLAAPAFAQKGPAQGVTGLPPETIGLACAPTIAFEPPTSTLWITGGQDSFVRRIYSAGELISVNAGRQTLEVGQEFFVRRQQRERGQRVTPSQPVGVRTVGWVKVYAVDDTLSLVTVVHGCDTFEIGDYLEPFVMPVVPTPADRTVKAERDNYGHVVGGSDKRTSWGERDYFVIDRGSEDGVTPGMQFVVYRNKRAPENFLYDLGEAVAVEVKPTTTTVLVTVSRDAINRGDLVAMRK